MIYDTNITVYGVIIMEFRSLKSIRVAVIAISLIIPNINAHASDLGCKFFLCIVGGVSNGGSECKKVVEDVIRSYFKKGKSAPSCSSAGTYNTKLYTPEERLECSVGNLTRFYSSDRNYSYSCGEYRQVWDSESRTYKRKFVKLSTPTVVQPYTAYIEYDFGYLSAEHKALHEEYGNGEEIVEGIQKNTLEVNYGRYYDPSGRQLNIR